MPKLVPEDKIPDLAGETRRLAAEMAEAQVDAEAENKPANGQQQAEANERQNE